MIRSMRSRALVFIASFLAFPAFAACGARSSIGMDFPPDAHADADAHAASDADADADTDADADAVADADTVPDAGPLSLVLSVVAVTKDLVQPGDQGLTPDGQPDGQFTATGSGAFDALVLVTVSANGTPQFGQQWDTLVEQDPIPPQFGFSFSTGAQTWILGVWENGARANDAQGRIALGPGAHTLSLYGASSGYFSQGMRFRLWGRANGAWIASNTATW